MNRLQRMGSAAWRKVARLFRRLVIGAILAAVGVALAIGLDALLLGDKERQS